LAHSKSALKRWRQSLDARERNRSTKSRTRTLNGSQRGNCSTKYDTPARQ
jgi:ribosomal protein S20